MSKEIDLKKNNLIFNANTKTDIDNNDNNINKPKPPKRFFKAIYQNPNDEVVLEGRYCGIRPKQAASKALTGIYKIFKKEGEAIFGKILFGIKETTRGSRGREFWYSGERILLDKPIDVVIKRGPKDKNGNYTAPQLDKNGKLKKINHYFDSVIKKAKKENCAHLFNYKHVDLSDQSSESEKFNSLNEKTKKNKKKINKGKDNKKNKKNKE